MFRSAREAKGITVDQIAQETRISARFLRAIEHEEFETLPGGLFSRGFIRTYASRVGLDPDQVIQKYQDLTSDRGADASALSTQIPVKQEDRYVVPLAVSGLVVMIVLFYVFDLRNTQTPQDAVVPLGSVAQSAEVAELPAAPVQSVSVRPEPTPQSLRATAETVRPEIQRVTVEIQVKELTWLLVQADGREEEFLLNPGTSQQYTADEALELKIGNAAGVTLNWNGQQFDNLGGVGQVLNLNITSDGIGGLAGNGETQSSTGPSA